MINAARTFLLLLTVLVTTIHAAAIPTPSWRLSFFYGYRASLVLKDTVETGCREIPDGGVLADKVRLEGKGQDWGVLIYTDCKCETFPESVPMGERIVPKQKYKALFLFKVGSPS